MSRSTGSLLLVGIKQEEGVSNKKIVLERHKASKSVLLNRLLHRQRRRLFAQQESSGSSQHDCKSSGDRWKPSPASSPSPAEVIHERLTSTIPPIIPTGDLNAATCSSVPTKASGLQIPPEANTSGLLYSKVEEPAGEEPANDLESGHSLQMRSWTCEYCTKGFPRKGILNKHINRIHKRLYEFNCEICTASFSWKENLTRHINTVHKNLRNFPCDVCGCSFKDMGSLKRHVNTVHERVREFNCETCDASFSLRENLTRHINCVHKNLRNFTCDVCEYSFKDTGSLKRHVNTVHKNLRNFLCTICGHSSKQAGALKKHINTVHKKEKQEKPENPS